jgi:hypothetical protein
MDKPTFHAEPIPQHPRVPPPGREPYHWEEELSQLRTAPGVPHRVYSFELKNQAINRANAITKRWKTLPLEHVTSAVRLIPAGKDAGRYGVWITWHGQITPERRAELDAASRKRGIAIRDSRARRPMKAVPAIKPRGAPRLDARASAVGKAVPLPVTSPTVPDAPQIPPEPPVRPSTAAERAKLAAARRQASSGV